MRSLGTRRVAQAAGAAMVAVIALAGCSAGQIAETAILRTPISGLNIESPDGSLLVTEKRGKLQHLDLASGQKHEITGVPKVAYGGQGGFGDVILHPQFASNHVV